MATDTLENTFNHLYRNEPKPQKGSVAICGYVKTSNRGFDERIGTCNSCVEIALNPVKHVSDDEE